jgi:hypothetical protein
MKIQNIKYQKKIDLYLSIIPFHLDYDTFITYFSIFLFLIL